ncbi:MAG: ABC transporter permease [Hespellia sp.]|nr:ABC transporter permease [Hespellia sp.]
MKAVQISFRQMLVFLKNDMMLAIACVAPVFIGSIFCFGIPRLEGVVTEYFKMKSILKPYYQVFDVFLASITPVFYCFVAAMVILEERDDHITDALYASPLGKGGYLVSRLGIPGLLSFVITEGLLLAFSLIHVSFLTRTFMAMNGVLQGVIFSLMVVTISSNKLEGMAVTKLTSLMMLGVAMPWFLPEKVQYVFWFLPSYWMGKAVWCQENLLVIPAVLLAGVWGYCLVKRGRC